MKFTASKKIIALVAAAAMLTGVARSLREFLEFEFFGGDRGW